MDPFTYWQGCCFMLHVHSFTNSEKSYDINTIARSTKALIFNKAATMITTKNIFWYQLDLRCIEHTAMLIIVFVTVRWVLFRECICECKVSFWLTSHTLFKFRACSRLPKHMFNILIYAVPINQSHPATSVKPRVYINQSLIKNKSSQSGINISVTWPRLLPLSGSASLYVH